MINDFCAINDMVLTRPLGNFMSDIFEQEEKKMKIPHWGLFSATSKHAILGKYKKEELRLFKYNFLTN